MKPVKPADPDTKSADIIEENIAALKALLPEIVVEGKIDFATLKQLLGSEIDEREEKYGLNWHGKRQARQLALTPSTGTLRPCPEESVDWDTTQNLMIEGDNLEVLKLLQKSYAGKIHRIYIDPPYNTGKDFVYPDNFQDNIKNYLELTGQVESGNKISSNTESSGRFHTDWLNMMYPRLMLAKNLLRDNGLLFVSIDDAEASKLRHVLDGVFGEERFVAQLVWKNKYNAGALTKGFSSVHEYILVYTNGDLFNLTAPLSDEDIAEYKGRDAKYDERGGYVTQPLSTSSKDPRPNLRYPITIDGREIWPEKQWIWSRERLEAALANDEVVLNEARGKPSVRVKQYLKNENGEMREAKPLSILIGPYNQEGSKETDELLGEDVFSFPKPVGLVRRLLALTVNDVRNEEEIVLDFFAGSGTTGQAVYEQIRDDHRARRYILVQLPEPLDLALPEQRIAAAFCDTLKRPRNIAEVTKERLRRAAKKVKDENSMFTGDLGFRVFKLDSTNIRTWDPNSGDLEGTLLESVNHLKDERTEQDVLFELLLKLGLDLTVPVEKRQMSGHDVHSVGAGTLLVCLSKTIKNTDIEALALEIVAWHKTQNPAGESTVVFRDSAFVDDVAKTNMSAILQQHGLENVRSL